MAGEGSHPILEGHQMGQILQSHILAQGRAGCWDSSPISELLGPGSMASSQPADGTVSQPVLTLFQPTALRSSLPWGCCCCPAHTPHPTKRCHQPLMTLLAGPQDSHTISVHQEKGHSWLLLSRCKSPEQHFCHDLCAHIHKGM